MLHRNDSWIKKSEWAFFFFFFCRKCWKSVRFAAAENWFKPPLFFIDRTKAVIQHFWRSPLSNWKKTQKNPEKKTHKNSYFLLSVVSLYTPYFVMFCVFLYGPFCHGAHKLDLSTLFSTFFFEHIFHLYYNWLNKFAFVIGQTKDWILFCAHMEYKRQDGG